MAPVCEESDERVTLRFEPVDATDPADGRMESGGTGSDKKPHQRAPCLAPIVNI